MLRQNRSPLLSLVFFSIAFLVLPLVPCFGEKEIANEDCLTCHDNIKLEDFKNSVHAADLCTSCHNDIRKIPHQDKPAKVNCSNCHTFESEVYQASDHGRARKSGAPAANCLDCHGLPHALLSSRDSGSPAYRLNIPKTCAKCHEDEAKMAPFDLLEKKPFVSYSETVHGKALLEKGLTSSAVCTDCHGSHNLSAPTNPTSKIYRANVPQTCGKCHENVLNTYLRSVHGKASVSGVRDAPVCTDCHGEHTIRSHKDPLSSVYPTQISKKTCGQCHAAEKIVAKYHLPADRMESYFQSYHGLASNLGVLTVANCASCHGAHDILPSSDPDSSVSKSNIQKTCGKCHPSAGAQLAKGSVHLTPSLKKDMMVYYVSVFYILLIVMTIGGMLAHNLLDFIHKFRLHYRRHRSDAKHTRFTQNERLQHFVLLLTFILLAYTGFALRFPNAWWALPFKAWDAGFDWRGVVHRVLAVVFVILSGYHVYYLFGTARGREQLKALMVRWRDFSDPIQTVAYNLGIRKEKPKYARYSYIEKAEYWALVWGSVVMILTGFLLTFENISLQFFPKWVFDVARTIHYYEAVLAVLAIIVWHFYFIIFDPLQYPLNLAMTTGKVSEEEHREDDVIGDKTD
jgi:cytochrome b subunit of formate dehydrogenase